MLSLVRLLIALCCCACSGGDNPQENVATSPEVIPVDDLDPALGINAQPPCGLPGQTEQLVGGSGWPEPTPPCSYHLKFDGEAVGTQPDGLVGPPHIEFTPPEDAFIGCGHTLEVILKRDEGTEIYGSALIRSCVLNLASVEWAETKCHSATAGLSTDPCQNPFLAVPAMPAELAGVRHFPDSPTSGGSAENVVKVRAHLSGACAGVKLYFRSFDPADGSSTSPPIRINRPCRDGVMQCDNRGEPREGALGSLLPEPNPNRIAMAKTDAAGVAEVTFTTSMHPGDNYIVAVSGDREYLDGVALDASKYQLKDAARQLLPIGAAEPEDRAVATPMLTVWRLLHLERDSMENPGDRNFARGQVERSQCLQGTSRASVLNYCEFKILPRLPSNSFFQYENGEFRVGSDMFRILPYVGRGVYPNTAQTVSTYLLSDSDDCLAVDEESPCPSSGNFELHDDDVDNLYPEIPPTRLLQDTDDLETNKLMRAFIRPVHDGGVAEVPWSLQVESTGIATHIASYKTCMSDEAYWCVYLQNAFQQTTLEGTGSLIREDRDPDTKNAVLGQAHTPGLLGFPADEPTTGALIFGETLRDAFRTSSWADLHPARTTTHELGHVLLACHGDNGVMCYPNASHPLTNEILSFTDTSIAKMRWLVQPNRLAPQFRFVDIPGALLTIWQAGSEILRCASDTKCSAATN